MATKKSFKDNPALQFITSAGNEAEQISVTLTELENEPQTLTITPQKAEREEIGKAPAGYKLNPMYIETKSKRLQLVLQPSLLARVKERAKSNGLSVNEYVHRILDEATKGEE